MELQLDHNSTATVHAKSKLDYELSHSSRLKYLGHPTVGKSEASESSSARSIPAPPKGDPVEAKPAQCLPSARFLEKGDEIVTINLEQMQNGRGSTNVDSHSRDMIEGSGRGATRTYDLKDFTKIQVDRLIVAEVTWADAFAVSMTADDNILNRLIAVREGSTLRLSLADGNYQLREHPRAAITLPVLDSIDLAGASRATIRGFSTDRPFHSHLSGASQLEGSIGAGDLEFNVGGASTVALSGSAKGLHLLANGASKLKLSDLKLEAAKVTVEATGAASVQLRGSAQAGAFKAQGASTLSLADLALEAADVELSGASNATVRV